MGLLTIGDLGGLGGPGWYGTHAPARGFREGVRALGGGGVAQIKMEMIWSHRRPAGFWTSPQGKGWRRVSSGNMTPAMVRVLLREIRDYEEGRRIDSGWRMTRPPRGSRRRPRVAPRPRPKPRPRPRPAPTPIARRSRPRTGATVATTLVSAIRRAAPPAPRVTTGQRYARQAAHGVPIRLATGGYALPSYTSFQK